MQILGVPIAVVVTIVGQVVVFIAGYVKLQQKVNRNSQVIAQYKTNCANCKAEMNKQIDKINSQMNTNITSLHQQIADIKDAVGKISAQLAKISGILQLFLKNKTLQDNNK